VRLMLGYRNRILSVKLFNDFAVDVYMYETYFSLERFANKL